MRLCPREDIEIPRCLQPQGTTVHPDHSRRSGKPTFAQKLTNMLASALAIAFAFVATGPVYGRTKHYVQEYVEYTYSYELVGVSTVAYFCLLALIMFCFATLVIQTFVQIVHFKSHLRGIR